MNNLVTDLLAALAGGVLTKFSDLPAAQIEALATEFSSGPFSDEHSAVMAGLVLVASEKEAEIAAFNASSPIHKIHAAVLSDGTPVLPISLLTWAGRGQGYSQAWDLLLSLPVRQITPADWPTPEALL